MWIEDFVVYGLDDDEIDGDEVVFFDGYDVFFEWFVVGFDVCLG